MGTLLDQAVQGSPTAVPGAGNPLDYVPMGKQSPDFSRYYVDNTPLLHELFNRLTGTMLDTRTDPAVRRKVPNMRAHMNEKGANAVINLLKNSGLDKNAILSNTDLERVLLIARDTTLDLNDHLTINQEMYEFDIIKDQGIVLILLFNTLELALRRSIGRGAAKDLSQMTTETQSKVTYKTEDTGLVQAPQSQGRWGRLKSSMGFG